MVVWEFCSCGNVTDEYEEKCYWCGAKKDEKKDDNEKKEKQLELFE